MALTGPLSADPERRARLLSAKLGALLKRYWPDAAGGIPTPAAGGMVVHHDDRAWALVDGTDGRGFARALLWALHRGVAELHVVMDTGPAAAPAARQAACFRTAVTVWAVTGADLEPVEADPLPGEGPLDPRAEPFVAVIDGAGAKPIVEWGALHAEVFGLEVGRVCTDADGAWLEVGIGKHDRHAQALMWPDQGSEALARVVAIALAARRSGDLTHPLNQLGRERWLRHRILDDPSLIGAGRLDPIAPPSPPADLRVPLLAPAKGTDREGGDILVACSVGFDPTFVPMAAELHAARAGADSRLVFVVPEAGAHALMRRAVADVRADLTLHTVPDDWQAATGSD